MTVMQELSWAGVIGSFGDAATEDFFHGRNTARARSFPAAVKKGALRKLDMLNAAQKLDDLKVPSGNRLEALSADLKRHYSIRVNDQWRITFRWAEGKVEKVRLVDYHA